MRELRGASSLPKSWLDACLRLTVSPQSTTWSLLRAVCTAVATARLSGQHRVLLGGRGDSIENCPGAPGGSSPVPTGSRALPGPDSPLPCARQPGRVSSQGRVDLRVFYMIPPFHPRCRGGVSSGVPGWLSCAAGVTSWGLCRHPAGPCLKSLVPPRSCTVVRTSCVARGCRRPACADVLGASGVPTP